MAEAEQDAFEAALRALERKERTTAELSAWLESRGYGPAPIEATLTRLAEIGELDDARFAQRYADDKRELQGWGAARIRDGLEARGVARDLIDTALGRDSHEAQLGRAGQLLARRNAPLDEEDDRARALGFLTRRGYDYEIAYEAVRIAAREAA